MSSVLAPKGCGIDSLPDNVNDVSLYKCWQFLRRLSYCQGPTGVLQSYYVYGDWPTCKQEKFNVKACWNIATYSKKTDKEEALQKAKAEWQAHLDAMMKEETTLEDEDVIEETPTIWNLRTKPPKIFRSTSTPSVAAGTTVATTTVTREQDDLKHLFEKMMRDELQHDKQINKSKEE